MPRWERARVLITRVYWNANNNVKSDFILISKISAKKYFTKAPSIQQLYRFKKNEKSNFKYFLSPPVNFICFCPNRKQLKYSNQNKVSYRLTCHIAKSLNHWKMFENDENEHNSIELMQFSNELKLPGVNRNGRVKCNRNRIPLRIWLVRGWNMVKIAV